MAAFDQGLRGFGVGLQPLVDDEVRVLVAEPGHGFGQDDPVLLEDRLGEAAFRQLVFDPAGRPAEGEDHGQLVAAPVRLRGGEVDRLQGLLGAVHADHDAAAPAPRFNGITAAGISEAETICRARSVSGPPSIQCLSCSPTTTMDGFLGHLPQYGAAAAMAKLDVHLHVGRLLAGAGLRLLEQFHARLA